ncbi:response regulator transcription factor [Jannaschia sp. 2305UL9-9]|uniref:response regulator transcription factor n=1 Tax=Jannaschia sp. 2305UL9-9 TaxID=3121638 RepID=UPI00352909C0
MSDSTKAYPNGPVAAPRRVLLIEDEANIATAIAFILGRAGWRVSTHSDGATALDAIVRHAPDVVVLDVMLPGRSGFDVLAAIREGDRPDLPVMMLTAKGQTKDRERAEALGVSRFMTKPFSNQDLLDAVDGLIAPGRAVDDGR